MKKIAVEEHFSTQKHIDALRTVLRDDYPQREQIRKEHVELDTQWIDRAARFLDIGEGRMREMAAGGIDMQVLSIRTPSCHVFEPAAGTALSREINDELSQAVRRNPTRFVGLAALAPQDPIAAADELERAVLKLGLRGACITSHVKGEYLDDRKYWPIFERAAKLGVPIYLHPRVPSPAILQPYLAYPRLWTAFYGFSAEAGLHAVRLICSGVFDEYPHLNIILGHLGEALPYWMSRMDEMWQKSSLSQTLKKTPSRYLKDNFYITTSGMFWEPAFLCAYLALGADRILLAVDYPTGSSKEAVEFMEKLPICDGDKEKICHLNAERLFSL